MGRHNPLLRSVLGIGVGLLLGGHAAQARDLPLVSGDLSIANTFLHGNAHVIIVGDSIQNVLVSYYPTAWKVDSWSGEVIGPNLNGALDAGDTGAYQLTWNDPTTSANYLAVPNQASGTDNITGEAPGQTQHVVFNGTAGAAGNLLTNRVYSVALNPAHDTLYSGGGWADIPGAAMTADALLYANPNGASGLTFNIRGSSDTTALASTAVDLQSSTSKLVDVPLSYTAQSFSGGNSVAAEFQVTPGQSPAANSNLVIAGVRISNGKPGFQMADINEGGQGVDYFLSNTNVTDANLSAFLTDTQTNIAYIWLGQNDVSEYDGAAWKVKMQDLINRYEADDPGIQFVLVSSYDTGSPTLADYANDLYQLSQENSNVLFLNLYQAAGSFSMLDANYLEDHIHPNAAGNAYFSALSNTLLEDAAGAAAAPEPATLAGLTIGAMILGTRRKRPSRA